ncbi:MAG: pyruvate, phosphate dikinase [Nitrospinota bacterium]
MAKYVYSFGKERTDGRAEMRDLLGGKGANLAEMASLGFPVPPGFTISTEACVHYLQNGGAYPKGMWEEVLEQLSRLEEVMGTKLGEAKNPLLVSVRSGARTSMPGMMDTVLNLGLNDKSVKGLASRSGNERFAYDSYRRFLTMFGDVVLGVEHSEFEKRLDGLKKREGVRQDTEMGVEGLRSLVEEFKALIREKTGKEFSQSPLDQLKLAINAVFDSWNTERAKTYRRIHEISEAWGTAVNVQAMVFGNLGPTSATGVAFTRNPSTGEKKFYGEFLVNAQGEDVVAGIRTPEPIERLREEMPEAYAQLEDIYQTLESHYKDMQDLEFTIQDGALYMLQTRGGKRTAAAAVRIAVEMVEEGLIDRKEALLRLDPNQMEQLLHPQIDPDAPVHVVAKGLAGSPGAAVGKAVFSAQRAQELAERGGKVILVRTETSPEDIGGMHASQAILTSRGGLTSHAAVVARGMGKCCVVGCEDITVDEEGGRFTVGDLEVKEGDLLTLNGTSGEVILGETPLVNPELGGEFGQVLGWADEIRTLGVWANADTPHDARVARDNGAEGIGLCRTEHMFFEGDRIRAVREMILAETEEDRRKALAKILPMQIADFEGIFEVMDGLPTVVRFLDPPLHEFLPKTDEDMKALAKDTGTPEERIRAITERHREFNPMLGHRGCRLGISHPEIYEMQAEAILTAACAQTKEGRKVIPEIMIPLVAEPEELRVCREIVEKLAGKVFEREGIQVEYTVGTMIELPRACVAADAVAEHAEFFSFGTNDLTQTVYGLSRDDAGSFLPSYLAAGLLAGDPFVAIDPEGVGGMVRMGVERGRKTRPDLKIGICGEHGGEPSSVEFFHDAKLDYVSCSPYRVSIARLAAAQATLKNPEGGLKDGKGRAKAVQA